MDNIQRFLEESPIAERIALPTRVVVKRLTLRPEGLSGIIESGSFTPSGEDVSELEIGGEVVARGTIVQKRGRRFFKVIEMGKGGEA
jgi:hypothetical protein